MTDLNWPLVWIDLEMTGLDPDSDTILEVALIVSDGQLEQIIEGPDIVVHADDEVLARMEPIVRDMHAASGLDEAARASTTTLAEAEAEALRFLREQVKQPRV